MIDSSTANSAPHSHPIAADVSAARLRPVLRSVLAYSSLQDYSGYDKHDGLNSPLLAAVFGGSRWMRIVAIQTVMRAPFNIRPLLKIPRNRNPKGVALFAHALLDLYATERREEDLREAVVLLNWLLENPARGFRGLSWGYPYPWQDLGFFAPRHSPNRVVTCWVGLAFLEACRLTEDSRYLDALPQIADFLTGEPRVLHDDGEMKCYSYVPDESVNWAVMDVPALVGVFLAEAGQILGRRDYLAESQKLVNWVVDKQTDYGAWFYTHPRRDSLITHDNYHTAIILDCLDRYRQATADDRFQEAYRRGLEFYKAGLFSPAGAPRWMSDREFPYDVHGAASGILCFTRAAAHGWGYEAQARTVLRWTLENLYDPRGFFYYQRARYYTKRFCLLRWCNAWMCRALASVIRYL